MPKELVRTRSADIPIALQIHSVIANSIRMLLLGYPSRASQTEAVAEPLPSSVDLPVALIGLPVLTSDGSPDVCPPARSPTTDIPTTHTKLGLSPALLSATIAHRQLPFSSSTLFLCPSAILDTIPLGFIRARGWIVAQPNNGDTFNFNNQDATIGNQVGKAELGSNIQATQNIYQRQNLAEAAAEIQQLLERLAQTNPTTIELETALHREIQQNPTLRARLNGALKAGGIEALKAIFNHPLVSIPVETIRGWLEAEP
jgi:hypothetical protein